MAMMTREYPPEVYGGAGVHVTVADRIVITGAGGQVGRVLAGEADRRGYRVHACTHRQFDITDPADPTPTWYLSTRKAQQLAEALAR